MVSLKDAEVFLLDWAYSECDSIGNVSTSLKVVLGSPVSFFSSDVLLDGFLVEEPVLSKFFYKAFWFLEDCSPCLDGCDIVLKVGRLARFSIELEMIDESFEVLEGINNVELFKIFDEGLNVWHFLVSASKAGLELIKVVVANHAVEETSNELWNSDNSATKLLSLWEWKNKVDCCCGVFARIEVFL